MSRSKLALSLLLAATAASARPLPPADTPASGPAVSCLDRRQIDTFQAAGDRAVLFRMKGGKTYRNDLPAACPAFARRDTGYAHSSPQDRLCSGEIVQLFERGGGFQYGGCALGKFTPLAAN